MMLKIMMMMNRRFLIPVLLFFCFVNLYSQDNDFGLWFDMNAKHKLLKNVDADLSLGIRTFNNTSQIEQYYIGGGLQYSFNKYLGIAASYRLNNTREEDAGYFFRHKIYFDIKSSVPLKRFDFSARLRLQRTNKTYIEDSEDLNSAYTGRLKLKGQYDIQKFPVNPYIYTELFSALFSGSDISLAKQRIGIGGEIKIVKKNKLEAEFIYQRDNTPNLKNFSIVSLNYKLKF